MYKAFLHVCWGLSDFWGRPDSYTLQNSWADPPSSFTTPSLGFPSPPCSLAYPTPTAFLYLPSASLFSFPSLSLFVYLTPSSLLLFTSFFFFFPALPHFPLFVFSVTSILRWGRRNKNNNKIPYSFHFLDQRWLSNRGGEFRAAFDAQYWCWLSMKIPLCYIWANYQRSTQLTWDTLAPCEAMQFKA